MEILLIIVVCIAIYDWLKSQPSKVSYDDVNRYDAYGPDFGGE